jgi:hypothetical protein
MKSGMGSIADAGGRRPKTGLGRLLNAGAPTRNPRPAESDPVPYLPLGLALALVPFMYNSIRFEIGGTG